MAKVTHTPAIADEICSQLREGKSLRAICRQDGMPTEATVRQWVTDRPEFAAQYTPAREVGYLVMAEEVLAISDDGQADFVDRTREDGSTYRALDNEHIQRSRLRVDTRKWLLSKCLPKIYGDKASLDLTAAVTTTDLTDPDKAKRLLELLTAATKRKAVDDGSDLV